MSHFTVMVIGENVDNQLAPFHEFECTGQNDQYVVDEDVTEEMQANIDAGDSIESALGYYGLEDKIVDDESKVDKVGDECPHKYGYAIVKDGKLIKAVNRTNPNRQWDWYQIGGRWSGFLKLKEGAEGAHGERSWMNRGQENKTGYCDSALKGAIDFEGMRQEDADRAAKLWDAAHVIIAGRTFQTWDQCKTEHTDAEGKINFDAARDLYNAQEVVQDFRKASCDKDSPFSWSASPSDFVQTREEFIADARATAINTFALLKDGVWYEKGEMGWWGMSNDKMTDKEWAVKIGELIDGLSDETPITIVDAHI